MDKVYILKTKIKQKSGDAVGTLHRQIEVAKGKRGLKTLTRQMDAFIGKVKAEYGEKATEDAPVVAFSYLLELHPQKDGTLLIHENDYICEKHLRMPLFPEKGQGKNEK